MAKKPGTWDRLSDGWYRVTMGTEYWLPKPPSDVEVVYLAQNLFYKPNGCRDLNKNNQDCWSMLITTGPDELLGQEIVWFNRKPDDATDVPLEVAEDICDNYNLMGKLPNEPDLTIFDINPALAEHPSFNNGIGVLDAADPRMKQEMMKTAQAGYINGSTSQQDMEQLQAFYDAQAFGMPDQMSDGYGPITTGGRHGGAEVHTFEDFEHHLGQSQQLPGGGGHVDTSQMGFANPANDEFFGQNPMVGSKKLTGLQKILIGVSTLAGAAVLLGKGQKNG